MKKIFLIGLNITCNLFLFSQNIKGLNEFKQIEYPTYGDTLIEKRKVYVINPSTGEQEYFYGMMSTPKNIEEVFNFTKNILKLNGFDIQKPTNNHNESGEAWILNDGFVQMSNLTIDYFKMVRREWLFDVEGVHWYIQLEVFNGHIFFRAGDYTVINLLDLLNEE